jgi:hypothetical protein
MQQIGQLFLLRTNINSVGSVLDSPVRKFFNHGYLHNLELMTLHTAGGFLGAFIIVYTRSFIEISLSCQSYPDLQPLYDAARSYLEIPQRINLLNTRVEVSSFYNVPCFRH